ncbi:MAG: GAF domain-containing protein [Gemmatimonadaceae bacterium]
MIDSPQFAQELTEILDTAIAVQNADFGNVQVYNETEQSLHIIAHRGFSAGFVERLRVVRGESTVCGRAAKSCSRMIVADVELDPSFAPHLEIARAEGFRAVHSTPITRVEGGVIGVISTHFRQPHTPSTTSLVETDVCARMAARVIERQRTPHLVAPESLKVTSDDAKVLHDALLSALQSKFDAKGAWRLGISPDLSALLQQATVNYAVSRRADGTLPERMIVDLKRVLRQVEDTVPAQFRTKLISDVVRWSIGAYYGGETETPE